VETTKQYIGAVGEKESLELKNGTLEEWIAALYQEKRSEKI